MSNRSGISAQRRDRRGCDESTDDDLRRETRCEGPDRRGFERRPPRRELLARRARAGHPPRGLSGSRQEEMLQQRRILRSVVNDATAEGADSS